jgi:outer membrane protein TolC
MELGRQRVALLVLSATVGAATACAPATTATNIHAAESAVESKTFARVALVATLEEGAVSAERRPATVDPQLEQSLDVTQLEEAALVRHPTLVAAAHRVRALVERARAEGRLPPPELMTEIWQVPFAKPYALDKAGMIMFSLRQQFPAAGMLDRMSEAMAQEALAEVARAGGEARMLVRDVDRAFADYAEATARRAAHEAHRTVLEQMVAAARARYTTGGALGDFTRADVERARASAEIEREQGMIEDARVRLNGLLARSPSAPLGWPRWTDASTVALTPERAAGLAATGSPEVAVADRMEKASRAIAEAADREATVPMFSAGLDTFLPVNGTPAGYGVSFGMSLPWAWGAASSRARSAEHKVHAEHAAADGMRVRTQTDAAMALAAVHAAERRYLITRDSSGPAARRALDAARAGYTAGGADILMWLDSARMAREVELDLAMAHGDLDRAIADLDRALGAHVPRTAIHSPMDESHGK